MLYGVLWRAAPAGLQRSAIAASIVSSCRGLDRCAFIPASKQRSASSSKAFAVIARIGMVAASGLGSARMAPRRAQAVQAVFVDVQKADDDKDLQRFLHDRHTRYAYICYNYATNNQSGESS